MNSEIDDLVARAGSRIAAASDLAALATLRTEIFGKSSQLSALSKGLKDATPEERKTIGQALNQARKELEALSETKRTDLEAEHRAQVLAAERLDLSENLGRVNVGHHHLITQTRQSLEDAFCGLGFTVVEGPEVETDWFNFEALNMPEGHPARSMWDTLYLDAGEPETVLLRTHTSPVQIRAMHDGEPPIYVIAPGRVYRQDTPDATHLPVFNQIEGLVVDEGITFGDLAGTIETFVKVLFGDDVSTRLRPSFFPFTEPSAEFDISTPDGGWLELGGCGMVHPNVLAAGGLDPQRWSGFAFGFGTDRLAKEKHGLSDLRDLVTNDIRFLEQF